MYEWGNSEMATVDPRATREPSGMVLILNSRGSWLPWNRNLEMRFVHFSVVSQNSMSSCKVNMFLCCMSGITDLILKIDVFWTHNFDSRKTLTIHPVSTWKVSDYLIFWICPVFRSCSRDGFYLVAWDHVNNCLAFWPRKNNYILGERHTSNLDTTRSVCQYSRKATSLKIERLVIKNQTTSLF